ncbi:MAG: disulfide bond formation protein DsbA [Myxococcales bacterium]|nr:MAG: disulfide bond formation protein DsbA [Myxococcales bacterium]
MQPIRITHFSDVLCVWAYVSQIRIDELRKTFGEAVEVDFHFVSVFGDTRGKLEKAWGGRGGARAYSDHVKGVAARFDHVRVHDEIWTRDAPCSSMPAHLLLSAARILEAREHGGGVRPAGLFERTAWAVREAFFRDLVDISSREALLAIAADEGLSVQEVEWLLDNGQAHARLAADLDLVREHSIQASPTLVFNEGRQRLTGNVGYRIIEANVRELIESPPGEHTWC